MKPVKFNVVFKGTERVMHIDARSVELVYEHTHQGKPCVVIETRSKQSLLVLGMSMEDVLKALSIVSAA